MEANHEIDSMGSYFQSTNKAFVNMANSKDSHFSNLNNPNMNSGWVTSTSSTPNLVNYSNGIGIPIQSINALSRGGGGGDSGSNNGSMNLVPSSGSNLVNVVSGPHPGQYPLMSLDDIMLDSSFESCSDMTGERERSGSLGSVRDMQGAKTHKFSSLFSIQTLVSHSLSLSRANKQKQKTTKSTKSFKNTLFCGN